MDVSEYLRFSDLNHEDREVLEPTAFRRLRALRALRGRKPKVTSGANIVVREQSKVTNTLSWLHGDHPSATLRTCLGSASLMTQRMDNRSAVVHPLSR